MNRGMKIRMTMKRTRNQTMMKRRRNPKKNKRRINGRSIMMSLTKEYSISKRLDTRLERS
jgi:hypothetical protein